MSMVRWPIGRKNQTPFAMGSFKCYVTPGGSVRPSVAMRYKGGGGGVVVLMPALRNAFYFYRLHFLCCTRAGIALVYPAPHSVSHVVGYCN